MEAFGKTEVLEGLFFVSPLCFHVCHLLTSALFPPAQFALGRNCHGSEERLLGQLACLVLVQLVIHATYNSLGLQTA